MTTKTMIPELETLCNEIYKPRGKDGKGRKIIYIIFALKQYIAARERLERERAKKKTWRHRVEAWWARAWFT